EFLFLLTNRHKPFPGISDCSRRRSLQEGPSQLQLFSLATTCIWFTSHFAKRFARSQGGNFLLLQNTSINTDVVNQTVEPSLRSPATADAEWIFNHPARVSKRAVQGIHLDFRLDRLAINKDLDTLCHTGAAVGGGKMMPSIRRQTLFCLQPDGVIFP